jgi:monothiol glutaredoxin
MSKPMLDETLRTRLDDLVKAHRVVLFMKGNRRSPACGFSAQVVGILDELVPAYETVDVLSSPEVRDGIKEYSRWPTIPQLYVDGQFVGGCDIVKEMHAKGELASLLGIREEEAPTPTLTISPAAAAALKDAGETDGEVLHLEIDAGFQYGLFFGPSEAGAVSVVANGVTVLMTRATARRAEGLTIDYVEGPGGAGFKMTSPLEPAKVKQITPAELDAMMKSGETFELLDVRTPKERAIASIPRARLLDAEGQAWLEGLAKDTPVVFHCHHGGRSQAAAEHFLGQGFKKVYNLRGGIDAWSQTVDASVPRY